MALKMKELPISERPYEKLEIYGVKKLSNAELLAIIIKTGTKEETAISLAQKILNLNQEKNIDNLRFLQNVSIEELCKIKGIGKIKAMQIIAAFEIAKRIKETSDVQKIQIKNSQNVHLCESIGLAGNHTLHPVSLLLVNTLPGLRPATHYLLKFPVPIPSSLLTDYYPKMQFLFRI